MCGKPGYYVKFEDDIYGESGRVLCQSDTVAVEKRSQVRLMCTGDNVPGSLIHITQ